MDMDNDRKREEDSAPSSEPDQMRLKLKVIAGYLVRGFAPVVSLLALIIAVIAFYGNQSNRAQIIEANSRVDSMSANMSDLKGEQELFKLPFGHEKSVTGEDRKKQGEREAKIIKNVTQMQIKLKITPTLEEQLQEAAQVREIAAPAASAPGVSHPFPGAVSAPAATPLPAVNEKKSAVIPKAPETKPVAAQKEAEKKPAAVQQGAGQKPAAAQKGTEKKPAAVPADKTSTKVQSLKDAIEKFNQDN
jgi:hypothetical protein